MHEAIGTVRQCDGSTASIAVDAAVCPRCRAGQGCGAGLFTGSRRTITIRVPVRDGLRVAPGDAVRLSIPRRSLARAALLAYGLPLSGLLFGTAVATFAGAGELLTVVAAVLGLATGFVAGRFAAGRPPCVSGLRPTLGADVAPGDPGAWQGPGARP